MVWKNTTHENGNKKQLLDELVHLKLRKKTVQEKALMLLALVHQNKSLIIELGFPAVPSKQIHKIDKSPKSYTDWYDKHFWDYKIAS